MTASEADPPAALPRVDTGEPAHEPALAVPILHAVTNDEIVLRDDFSELAHRVMSAGGPRVAVHLRGPHLPGRRLYEIALQLVALQRETGAWLVVNDRVDVAMAAGARGAQLTSRSIESGDARRFAPQLALGASVHSAGAAERAAGGGADWLVAGHVFETATHPAEEGRGLMFIQLLSERLSTPVIAIGGIRPHHVPVVRAAGGRGVAAIRGVWQASDAAAAVIDYLSAYDAYGGT